MEDEKLANAQLTERLRALKERYEAGVAEATATATAAEARITDLDLELQRLRKANDQLRQSNAALRTANEEGVGEPHLINQSMMVELESIRAMRSAEVAEATEIISALTPLVRKAGTDAGNEEAH